MEAGPSSPPPSAAPLTALIARRVRHFRQAADMRGSALATKLVALGVPWNRTTVAKFETGHRAAISVQELKALALALDVPPAALLVDPTGDATPLAEGVAPDPWTALLWLVGREPLDGQVLLSWRNEAGQLVQVVHQAYEALGNLAALENPIWSDDQPTERDLEALDNRRRAQFSKLRAPLQLLAEQGVCPPLPDYVITRAAQLGIDLPVEG